MTSMKRIASNLWFDSQAEEAAKFYTSIFKNSKIGRVMHYGKAGFDTHHRPEGSVMTVEFQLDGNDFIALNGGPVFSFTEAISFVVNCATQEEVDYYWKNLSEGGDPTAQQCGWLKDKYNVSWQIVPTMLNDMIADPDKTKSERAMNAMLQMKKLDIEGLQRAFRGK